MATYDFSRLADIKKIAGDRYDEVIRGTLLDMTRRVIMRTPVGDPSQWQSPAPPGYVGGTARGNWQASINQPEQGILPRADEGGNATLADAQPAIEAASGNVYYLVNNIEYILPLENGWSNQAPAGMARITLRELGQSIDEQLAKLPR